MSYSDIVRRTLVTEQTVQGISLAEEYGLSLVPGRNLKPDGNCLIELIMDQLYR